MWTITVFIILTDFSSSQLVCFAVFQNSFVPVQGHWNQHLLTSSSFLAQAVLKFHSFECLFSVWKIQNLLVSEKKKKKERDLQTMQMYSLNRDREQTIFWSTTGEQMVPLSFWLAGRGRKGMSRSPFSLGCKAITWWNNFYRKIMHFHWNRNVLWNDAVTGDIFDEKHFL